MCTRSTRKLDDVLTMLKQNLEMSRTIHGKDTAHPDIVKSLDRLGLDYWLHGKLDDALTMLEQSLEVCRTIYGKDMAHPYNVMSVCNLGA